MVSHCESSRHVAGLNADRRGHRGRYTLSTEAELRRPGLLCIDWDSFWNCSAVLDRSRGSPVGHLSASRCSELAETGGRRIKSRPLRISVLAVLLTLTLGSVSIIHQRCYSDSQFPAGGVRDLERCHGCHVSELQRPIKRRGASHVRFRQHILPLFS